MFICMSKINFIIHSFLKISHFKEFYWLISLWPWKQYFCQIRDWWLSTSNNIRFNFRLPPGKTNAKIFQKIKKNIFRGHFISFLLRFGQKWILLEKRVLSVFKYSTFLTSCKKLEKTNNDPFQIEIPAGRPVGQTYDSDFIGPSVGLRSN